MKKICFVTAARSEYGLLKWLMKEVDAAPEFKLQLVVTGAHLLEEQGHTIDAIREDGFSIDKVVDTKLDTSTKESIASSMGKMAIGMADAFAELMPDYVAVLGDRYELLPICNTAFVMNIPIIHISGGDVTEGAIDDGIRNAVTMLATYHFPGTMDSANNITRMRNSDHNVWVVGEPGLDSFNREQLMDREELAKELGIDNEEKWVLFTYHPETRESLEKNLEIVRMCISLLLEQKVQVVATYANADLGGGVINEYLEGMKETHSNRIKVIPSLGTRRYLSFMKEASLIIGNSSSGIVEAPVLGIPVVNIGKRQAGRHICENVIQAHSSYEDIGKAISVALSNRNDKKDCFWGDGHTSEKVIEIMKKELH